MSYIYVIVAQNWALYIILGLQFWSKVKNSTFLDTNFPAGQLCGPRGRTEKNFWTRNCFAVLHMSQLKF